MERKEERKKRKRRESKHTSRADLLSRSRNTNNNTLTPTLVASLQSSSHNSNITRAVESVITSTIRHLDQLLLNTLILQFSRVNEVRGSKLLGPLLLRWVHVHNDDFTSFVLDGSLYDTQPDTSSTEYGNGGTFFDLGGFDGSSVSSGDTTAEKTSSVHGSFFGDGDDGDIRYDGVLGEGGCSHEVKEIFALALEAGGTVWHDTTTLSGANFTAKVGLAGFAEFALFTFWSAGRG